MAGKFDRSSKWLLDEQGVGILHVAGERNVLSCRALHPEVVQPAQLPDGLLEVTYANRREPALWLIEVATYPETRVPEQLHDDIMLVRQVRGVLPETVVLVLKQRGTYRVPDHREERSERGSTTSLLRWKVIELWALSAEELLSAANVGVVPWAALAHYEGRPEVLLRRCRDRIDREGGHQRDTLLAVTQVFAELNFNTPELLSILGGRNAMIESPLIQSIGEEFAQARHVEAILQVLRARFKAMTPTIEAGLQQIKDKDRLHRLTQEAALCGSLPAFEEALNQELPQPPPASTRGKRGPRKPTK